MDNLKYIRVRCTTYVYLTNTGVIAFNIGHYWKIGPQQTLYLPGCCLRKGKNEVVIFEQQNNNLQTLLKTTDKPVLEELKTDGLSDQKSSAL